jgi:uncharacterized protein (DUF58 family)
MASVSGYKYLPSGFAESLRNLQIKVKRALKGDTAGAHKSSAFGASVEFADYREYTPGDAINMIDWAVYARSDKYMIRRYEEETTIRGYILLDTSESMNFKSEGDITKMEYASTLAAGIMYVLINQQDSAGLVTFDTKIRTQLPPVRSMSLIDPHLKALEAIRPSGKSDIESVMHNAAELLKSKSLVIIISDLLEKPEKILKGVSHLHFLGHEVMLMHVLDSGELNLKMTGVTELRELESGSKIIINTDEIRDAYSKSVESYIEGIQAGCAALSVDYSLNDTATPVNEAIYQRTVRI